MLNNLRFRNVGIFFILSVFAAVATLRIGQQERLPRKTEPRERTPGSKQEGFVLHVGTVARLRAPVSFDRADAVID
jgi:hypothetical protein